MEEPMYTDDVMSMIARVTPETGPLASTPDEMPVIGEVAGSPGMFVVGGTYSFTFAPLWGDLAVALIHGESPPMDIADLSPDRLRRKEFELVERNMS